MDIAPLPSLAFPKRCNKTRRTRVRHRTPGIIPSGLDLVSIRLSKGGPVLIGAVDLRQVERDPLLPPSLSLFETIN